MNAFNRINRAYTQLDIAARHDQLTSGELRDIMQEVADDLKAMHDEIIAHWIDIRGAMNKIDGSRK